MLCNVWLVLSQLLRKAKQRNLVLPNVKSQEARQGEGFEAATVRAFSYFAWICYQHWWANCSIILNLSDLVKYLVLGSLIKDAYVFSIGFRGKGRLLWQTIATLDFVSLYPSLMMAYNFCYCISWELGCLVFYYIRWKGNKLGRNWVQWNIVSGELLPSCWLNCRSWLNWSIVPIV